LTANVGIIASMEGILGGFYFALPALAILLTPCLIAFALWTVLVGVRVLKLRKVVVAAA
jgi:hypothetical protein